MRHWKRFWAALVVVCLSILNLPAWGGDAALATPSSPLNFAALPTVAALTVAAVPQNNTQRITVPRGQKSVTIQDNLGRGESRKYLLKANKGQTITVTVQEGPLPFIFPPNDPYGQRELTGGGAYSRQEMWTGTLPDTGDYTVQLESNRSGYDYQFTIEF